MAGDGRHALQRPRRISRNVAAISTSVSATRSVSSNPRWIVSPKSTKHPACANAWPAFAPSLNSCSSPITATWSSGSNAVSPASSASRHREVPPAELGTRTFKPLPSTSRSCSTNSLFETYPHRRPHLCHAHRPGRLRPHPQAARPRPRPANWSFRRTSTTASRRCSTCRRTCPIRASPNSPRRRRTHPPRA